MQRSIGTRCHNIHFVPCLGDRMLKLNPNRDTFESVGPRVDQDLLGGFTFTCREPIPGIDGFIYRVREQFDHIVRFDHMGQVLHYVGEKNNSAFECCSCNSTNSAMLKIGCIYFLFILP